MTPEYIKVLPDLLKPAQFLYHQQRFSAEAVQWFYSPFTATPDDLAIPAYGGSFSHMVGRDNQGLSALWEPALVILHAACDQQGLVPDSILRIRFGLATRTPEEIIHTAHVDHPVLEHRTGIWYPATSSGPTRVYAEKSKRVPNPRPPKNPTLVFEQTPTANLWFDFPGEHYHSSSTPSLHDERLVLTINYTVK